MGRRWAEPLAHARVEAVPPPEKGDGEVSAAVRAVVEPVTSARAVPWTS